MIATARTAAGNNAVSHHEWYAVGAQEHFSDATTFDLEMKIATLVAI